MREYDRGFLQADVPGSYRERLKEEHYELHNGFEKSGRAQTFITSWCKCYCG